MLHLVVRMAFRQLVNFEAVALQKITKYSKLEHEVARNDSTQALGDFSSPILELPFFLLQVRVDWRSHCYCCLPCL